MLGTGSAVAAGGGAFLGYNTQWQDLIVGVEATYTHTNLNTTASSTPIARFFPDVNTGVGVSAAGNLNLTDYGTARGRAGYVIGNFLPYGFIGMAVGRASYSVNTAALVQQTSNNTVETFLFTNSAGQNNALLWGYTVGAGLNLFKPTPFINRYDLQRNELVASCRRSGLQLKKPAATPESTLKET